MSGPGLRGRPCGRLARAPEETAKSLQARIRDLERANAHLRAVAEADRRLAADARQSAERAWSLAAWGGAGARERREG
jgi:hypothetical protein